MTTRREQSKSPPVPLPGPGTTGGYRLVLENVRCFARGEVPLGAQVTVVIGQNGSGKTSIIEALASLAPGEGEGLDRFPLRRGASGGSIALHGTGAEPLARWADGDGRAERAFHLGFMGFEFEVHEPEELMPCSESIARISRSKPACAGPPRCTRSRTFTAIWPPPSRSSAL